MKRDNSSLETSTHWLQRPSLKSLVHNATKSVDNANEAVQLAIFHPSEIILHNWRIELGETKKCIENITRQSIGIALNTLQGLVFLTMLKITMQCHNWLLSMLRDENWCWFSIRTIWENAFDERTPLEDDGSIFLLVFKEWFYLVWVDLHFAKSTIVCSENILKIHYCKSNGSREMNWLFKNEDWIVCLFTQFQGKHGLEIGTQCLH